MNIKDKKLLILAGKPIGTKELVARAKELGLYVIVTDYLPKEYSIGKQLCDECWDISTADINTLSELCKTHNIEGIATGVHEFNINRMLDICALTDLQTYCSKETWKYCDSKIEFKYLCESAGIPIAKKFNSKSDVTEKDYPVIVKPIDGSGSRGFHICNNSIELDNFYDDSIQFSPSRNVLIEEYIPYNSVIIHYTLVDGKCLYSGMSDKISCRFKNTGSSVMGLQTFPSKGENVYLDTLNDKVCKMFENAGFKNGPIWIEAFYNGDDHFVFNEMGYRFGGSLTYFPVKYFWGIDQLDLMLYNTLGEKMDLNYRKQEGVNKYCILPIHIKSGKIIKVDGVEEMKSQKNLHAFVPVHFEGETIEEWGSAQQVFAYIHILYNDIPDLKDSITQILCSIKALDENNNNMLYTLYNIDSLQ